ncbi:hypothetical protein pdam_00010931 [Pocillopora damicornis]|uniref:Death domain-containing protein n=1 Tax=Pocillopora damicornis TaxID=46731 RepID=A0A3M6UH17_POCDA|nr:hypothetical protein pdam_00010931 [Pocillopora damicornis]
MTFCFWCVYCRRGAPRKKRATVFASKPNPRRDLIFFRFYIYSDNKDSTKLIHILCLYKRVKTQDREQFPDSWKGMEKPFKMYNNSKNITVKLMVDPEKGWELDETPGEQVYIYDDSHGGRFRYKDACAFAVKPVKGREVEEFSCSLSFQQEGHDTEHAIYLNPGFSLVEKSVEPANACTHFNSAAGCSTSSAPAESDRRSSDEQPKTPRDSKLLSSLLDNRSFLKKVCDRLDREMKNYGDYRDVCSHYGFDRYEVAANFAKHDAGPSTALLEYLAVKYPKLTVDEFASVLKNVTQRNDVVESLEEYDNE